MMRRGKTSNGAQGVISWPGSVGVAGFTGEWTKLSTRKEKKTEGGYLGKKRWGSRTTLAPAVYPKVLAI